MDERLKKALDISNYMVTLNNQKRLLKEKFYENSLAGVHGKVIFNGDQIIEYIDPIPGQDLTVTLNIELQEVVIESLIQGLNLANKNSHIIFIFWILFLRKKQLVNYFSFSKSFNINYTTRIMKKMHVNMLFHGVSKLKGIV